MGLELAVRGKGNGSLIVTIDEGRGLFDAVEFIQQELQVEYLMSYCHEGNVLGFSH